MTIKALTNDQWRKFVHQLIENSTVYGVQEKHGNFFTFQKLTDPDALRLDYDVAYMSPRKYFQPPRETLLRFSLAPQVDVSPVVEDGPFVLLGVHPYDLKAINQMDAVFAKDNRDTNYTRRRAAATVIASDPLSASDWSFWPWMNAATVDTGYDLFVTDIGDAYLVEIGTDKGKALFETHGSGRDATEEEIAKRTAMRDSFKELCKPERAVNVSPSDIPGIVASQTDHPVWEEKSRTCYSCGTCNHMCPTCYCFDVREDLDLDMKGGRRVRMWDGCLLQDFASIASGENFREHRVSRFQHRLLRKSNYVPEIIDTDLACVGCGRCSSGCLPDIADPVKILNTLAEEK